MDEQVDLLVVHRSQSGFGFKATIADAWNVLPLVFAKQGGDPWVAREGQVRGGAGSAMPGRHKTAEELSDGFHIVICDWVRGR